ncbi:hypothetical protein [Parahaliea mediterranea]|uniref:DUF481 domain-containing protein n=1 Tax=Parahaliea mediterranea TaxID=651086 RepID=A0A939DEW4_9GAMM|nr:hypothetical protein [Parahaliea mediterranea]MBN7796879.1 hypothetical protein [Parahaliea mediterranea]
MVEPYLVATTIEGDGALGRLDGLDVSVDFDSILDKLDAAGMVRIEAYHRSNWGLFLDWGMMDLKGSGRTEGERLRVEAEVRQAVTQFGLMYHMDLANGSVVDFFFGARYWDNELDLKLRPGKEQLGQRALGADPSWTDGFLGLRASTSLTQAWRWYLYADVGMGDSEYTGDLKSGFVYSFTDRWRLELGYNFLWVDYEEGKVGTPGSFKYDTVTHGPLVGLQIHF